MNPAPRLKKPAVKVVGKATSDNTSSNDNHPAQGTGAGPSVPKPNVPKKPESASPDEDLELAAKLARLEAGSPGATKFKSFGQNVDDEALKEVFMRTFGPRVPPVPSTPKTVGPKMEAETVKKATANVQPSPASGSDKDTVTSDPDAAPYVLPTVEDDTDTDTGSPPIPVSPQEQYLQMASEYLHLLPRNKAPPFSVNIVQAVAILFRKLVQAVKLDKLRTPLTEARLDKYVAAAVEYLKSLPSNLGKKNITIEYIRAQSLYTDGDYLLFCALLMEASLIPQGALAGLLGIATAFNNVSPSSSPKSKPGSSSKPVVDTKGKAAVRESAEEKDTGNKSKAEIYPAEITEWPQQDVRENRPAKRTVVLRNVSSIKSLSQLQSLVWGGKVEQFQWTPGNPTCQVRFMTGEACEAYFKSTSNGIKVPGDENTLVLVDLHPAPNSVNDLLGRMIEGGNTRCVRALGADEEWSDAQLKTIIRANLRTPELDKIVRGRTTDDTPPRFYIEFRFGNIFNALTFKHFLENDPDWEQCDIHYAKDPCDAPPGVHE